MESYLAGLIYDDRSGSTYFASKLSLSPYVSVTIESKILTTLARLGNVVQNQGDVVRIVRILCEEEKFRAWSVNKELLVPALEKLSYPISMEKFLVGLLDTVFDKKEWEVEKIYVIKQVNVTNIEVIARTFPRMKFLLIYRDGRAVFASKKKALHSVYRVPMEIDPTRAAAKWEMTLRRATAVVPPARLFHVRYETLLEDELIIMQEAMMFIGGGKLCYSAWKQRTSEPVASSSKYLSQIPEAQKHLHENIGYAPKLERIEGWKKELADIEIWLYERRAGAALKEHQYALSNICRPALIRRLGFFASRKLAESRRRLIVYVVRTKKWVQSPRTVILAASSLIRIKRK